MKKINLHIHSSCSDGSLGLKELFKVLKEHNYDLVALTDHDCIDGNKEAKQICKSLRMNFIPGIEITSYLCKELNLYDDTFKVHIVGLNVNSKIINSMLKKVERNKRQYHLSILKQYSNCENFDFKLLDNRVACAEYLVSQGCFNDVKDAMQLFKVSNYSLSIKQSIELIHKAGGVAIWAHPFILPKNGDFKIKSNEVEKIYEYMRRFDVDGLEAYYLEFSSEEQEFLYKLSQIYGGVCSTGTDFHADYPDEYDLLKINGKTDNDLLSLLNI